MDFETGIEQALDGNAVLFLGAGFSGAAKNLRGEHCKSGHDLAAYLSEQSGLPTNAGLEDAAEEYASKFGEDRLISELREEFTAVEVADNQVAIAAVPWKRVYTTNYDNVFEVAAGRAENPTQVVTISEEIDSIPKDATLCVHLNGYIDRLTRDTIWSEIKLTETSYLTSSIASSPWASFFRRDLRIAAAVFFVGYSAYDLDIKRILFEDEKLKDKVFFVVGKGPSQKTTRRVQRFGKSVSLDAAEFARKVHAISADYTPSEKPGPILYSLQPYRPPVTPTQIRDADVFDLLMRGEVTAEMVASSINEGSPYYLERDEVELVVRTLNRGVPVTIVHSDLGNGKTLLLDGVKYRVAEADMDVYSLERRSFETLSELEHIAAPDRRTILIIEDYQDWLDEIEHVLSLRNSNLQLLLTARSSPHDVFISRIHEFFDYDEIAEIPVDKLSSGDIEWLVEFLELYGLWGEDAGKSRRTKQRIIANRCRSQFSSVLLYVLSSPQMVNRLEDLLIQLNDRRDFYEVLVAILVLAIISHRPSVSTLVDVYGEQVLKTPFRRNEIVRELVDIEASEIRMRSSVVSKFILKQIADPNITVGVLTRMMRIADENARMSRLHKDLARNLMRFSQVQAVLPETGATDAVYSYYESIKNVGMARANPYFWLQYAIAATVYEDFERASSYFDTAYAYADRLEWFNPFQIDNHKARFLLRKAIRHDDVSNAMTAFRQARAIVNRQVTEKRRYHYPFRVASEYAEFYDTFAADLQPKERQEIFRAARFVLKRIGQLADRPANHRDVIECAHNMEYLVMRFEEEFGTPD